MFSHQRCSAAEIRSHSPIAGFFTIMWRCMMGGWCDQYFSMDFHVNFSMSSSSSSLRWLRECSSWGSRSISTYCGSKRCHFTSRFVDGTHLPQFQSVRTNILQDIHCSLPLYLLLQLANHTIAPYSNHKQDRFVFDKTIKPARGILVWDWGRHSGWCRIESDRAVFFVDVRKDVHCGCREVLACGVHEKKGLSVRKLSRWGNHRS